MSDTTVRKSCTRCELVKPADQFSPNRQNKSGRAAWCKSCYREYTRALRNDPDPTIREKCCTVCKSVKPIEQFNRNRQSSNGFQSHCKSCQQESHRDWYVRNSEKVIERTKQYAASNPKRTKANGRKRAVKRLYGLTPVDYGELLESQDGKCGGCGDAFGATTPRVDHDHETGEIRGLLCKHCNTALGMAFDSPDRLLGLVRYLRRPRLQIVASGDRRQA